MRVLTRYDRLELTLDERRLVSNALEQLDATSSLPLVDAVQGGPRESGVYLLEYLGAHPLYERFARSETPIYTGSTNALHDRLMRHRRSLTQVVDLDVSDFSIKIIECPSVHAASLLEGLLVDAAAPLWNQRWLAGFGSRAQGPGRVRHQRRSAWDTLHQGREWATGKVTRDRDELVELVRRHAESVDPGRLSERSATR